MKKIPLKIAALSHSVTQSHSYAVVLAEVDGNRKLPIIIGGFEAQAIAVTIEKIKPGRPLTHDLMKNIFEEFQVELEEVVINNLQDGVFYALLVCKYNGQTIEIDSRTSDAIALAVRFDCPISAYDFVMDQAGIMLEEEAQAHPESTGAEGEEDDLEGILEEAESDLPLSERDDHDLQRLLQKAIEDEDYERAARIRDEISRRHSS